MIQVTRINGEAFYINPDVIMTVETTHDTVITLLNGERFVISENAGLFQERFIAYKQAIQNKSLTPLPLA